MELKISKEQDGGRPALFVVVYANGANLVHFNTIKQKYRIFPHKFFHFLQYSQKKDKNENN
ncbi:hypothetical protein LOS25_09680 [Enterococcus faecium]|nr:hypothetical protein [Enterococcus faecium]